MEFQYHRVVINFTRPQRIPGSGGLVITSLCVELSREHQRCRARYDDLCGSMRVGCVLTFYGPDGKSIAATTIQEQGHGPK